MKQLESGFERKINWIKYQSKLSIEGHNQDLYYLTDPIFKGVNRGFFLPFENNAHRTRHTGYFIQKVEIKYFNFMIDRQSFFDQPVKNDSRTYDKIQEISTSQKDDEATGSLLHYANFIDYNKATAIDLSQHQALESDQKTTQQIKFIGNLDWVVCATMFFIIKEAKETKLNFSKVSLGVLQFYYFNIMPI